MPLLTFDIIEGRSATEIRTMLDAAHRAVLTAFNVPERDRYQMFTKIKITRWCSRIPGWGLNAATVW